MPICSFKGVSLPAKVSVPLPKGLSSSLFKGYADSSSLFKGYALMADSSSLFKGYAASLEDFSTFTNAVSQNRVRQIDYFVVPCSNISSPPANLGGRSGSVVTLRTLPETHCASETRASTEPALSALEGEAGSVPVARNTEEEGEDGESSGVPAPETWWFKRVRGGNRIFFRVLVI